MNRLLPLLLLLAACETSPQVRRQPPNENVLFQGGRFLNDEPRWRDEGADPSASCQAPRDAERKCAAMAEGCVPLPLIGAWSPCYGVGALCTEEFRGGALAQRRANPPPCYCSCGPEHAAAKVRDEGLRQHPPE